MSIRAVVLVTSTLALAGTNVEAAPEPLAAARADAPLSDAEAVAVLATSHKTHLEAARVARVSATDRRVKAFAERIGRHARAAQRREAALRREVGGEAEVDTSFRFAERAAFAGLRERPRGRAFDRGYLDDQIEALSVLLYTIHNRIRPYAQTPALRDEVAAVAAQAGDDLAAAEELREALADATP